MESTHVYWVPVYELLESRGFEAVLVNAPVSQRARTQDRLCLLPVDSAAPHCGLLRGSFRPSEAIGRMPPPPTEEDSDGDMLGPALALGRPVPRDLFDTMRPFYQPDEDFVSSILFCETSLRAAIPSSEA
jgi:hypothetical protein